MSDSLPARRDCTKCGEHKALEQFSRSKTGLYGRRAYCSSCGNAANRRRYQEVKAERAVYNRQYREQNRRYLTDLHRDWVEKNRERLREYNRRYEAAHRAEKAARSRNRRALERSGSHTVAEVQTMYKDQNGLCAYCESSLNLRYEVDHMHPVSRGGSNDWTNLALTCQNCNRRKSNKTAEEFVEWDRVRSGSVRDVPVA